MSVNAYVGRRAVKQHRKALVTARGRRAQLDALHAAYGLRFANAPGLRCADLFAGFGGFSEAIKQAGSSALWVGNHWRVAVEIHELNHPDAIHVCQDLHQAAWEEVPRDIDLVVASPACQGHSSAGKPRAGDQAKLKHDTDRATALAVINCLEVVRPTWSVIENVPAWLDWPLFDPWCLMLKKLGYSYRVLRLWAHHYGSPQARQRVFVVATLLGEAALERAIAGLLARGVPKSERLTVASFARFDEGTWKPSEVAGEKGSRQRIEAGLALGVDQWWCQHVTGHKGKRIDTQISTLTGADQHVLCRRLPEDRVEYRTLLPVELLAVQSFPASYRHPPVSASRRPGPGEMKRGELCQAIGNAIDVRVGRAIVEAVQEVHAVA